MRNYTEEMDVIVGALQMAELTLQALPDDSVYELEKIIEVGKTAISLVGAPVEFGATIRQLENHKKALEWAIGTILTYKSMKKE